MSASVKTLAELLALLRPPYADLLELVSDPSHVADEIRIRRGRALDLAGPDDLTFCKGADPQRTAQLLATRSHAIVVNNAVLRTLDEKFLRTRALLVSEHPRALLAALLSALDTAPSAASQIQAIHPNAQIGVGVTIGPGAVIGDGVVVGQDCVIGPNTVVEHAIIGQRTSIGANCSIGGEGFGYEIDDESGQVIKLKHFGRVIIGDDVEIFSNTCIARGSLRDTVIGNEVKIDNLVHVAHNCQIGKGAFLIANAMIGGSAVIGDHAWVAPSTSVINGVTIGRWAMTGLGTCLTKSCEANSLMVGVPGRLLRQRLPADSPVLTENHP